MTIALLGGSALYRGQGSGQVLASSSNGGGSWSMVSSPLDGGAVSDIAFGAGTFVAVGTDASFNPGIVTSSTGSSWTERAVPPEAVFLAGGPSWVERLGTLWVAGGQIIDSAGNALILTSPNGASWSTRTVTYPISGGETDAGAYGLDQWIVSVPIYTYYVPNTFWTFASAYDASTDGITWGAQDLPFPTYTNHSSKEAPEAASYVAFGGGRFVLVSSEVGQVATSTDGLTWSAYSVSGLFIPKGIDYLNGHFLCAAGNELAVSTDGLTWTLVDVSPADPGPFSWDGTNYWLVASNGLSLYKSADTNSWSLVHNPWEAGGSQLQAVLGVTVGAPPVRQYPRDDNLALGAVRQRTGPGQSSSVQNSNRQGFSGTYT